MWQKAGGQRFQAKVFFKDFMNFASIIIFNLDVKVPLSFHKVRVLTLQKERKPSTLIIASLDN